MPAGFEDGSMHEAGSYTVIRAGPRNQEAETGLPSRLQPFRGRYTPVRDH